MKRTLRLKRTLRIATCVVALNLVLASVATAQEPESRKVPPPPDEKVPTAPAAEELKIPKGEHWLGTIRLPVDVLANGKPLAAGRYRVRLTGRIADDVAVGQLAMLERWVEFVQGTEVKGAAMAPVVPSRATEQVADSPLPPSGRFRVQHLKGDDYLRVWYNFKGDQILIYLPIQPRGPAVEESVKGVVQKDAHPR